MRSVAPIALLLASAQAMQTSSSTSTSSSSSSTPTSWSSTSWSTSTSTSSTTSSTSDSSTTTSTSSSTSDSSTTTSTPSSTSDSSTTTTTTTTTSTTSTSEVAQSTKWPLPSGYPSYPIAPDEIDFSCVKTQSEYTSLVPRCAQFCHTKGLLSDGCDRNDHICHCKNFGAVGAVIEPCLFGDNPGPWGPCSDADIGALAQFAGYYCGFWNATAAKAQEFALSMCHKYEEDGEGEGEEDEGEQGPGFGKGKGKAAGVFSRLF